MKGSYLIVTSAVLAGCSTIRADPIERRVVYACNYGPDLTVTYGQSVAKIESEDGTVTLRRRPPPGPGFWYQSATHSLRGDGDEITYIDRQMAPKHCHARIDRAVRLFDALRTDTLSVPAIERFPLRDGAAAHARFENRAFSGKIVMTSEE